MPKPFVRETMVTKKISEGQFTEINFKACRMEVTQYKIEKKTGLFGHDSVNFQIETEVPGHRFKYLVQRKDADFYGLRQCLC